ncbi:MAG TPA: hypothetical protein VNX68_13225 [Nitrosopumilaceae archaeon]|jgi:hypothetical protein|nr:hypothetical protein [Nitrosopumilaceae archaeon]
MENTAVETIEKKRVRKYNVISPDGFAIHFSDTYTSKKKAMEAFETWKKRYEPQGYYSSSKFGRIPLEELGEYCDIIPL